MLFSNVALRMQKICNLDSAIISIKEFVDIKCRSFNARPIRLFARKENHFLCEVRRQVAWGETMQIPGVGIKFIDISENQLEDFCKVGHIS